MSDDEEPLINLTPLIDVVFVVLIMFIVIAPMLEVERVELASAGESALEIKESSSLSMSCLPCKTRPEMVCSFTSVMRHCLSCAVRLTARGAIDKREPCGVSGGASPHW